MRVLSEVGWDGLIKHVQGRGDMKIEPTKLDQHPAVPLLQRMATEGVPAIMSDPPWSDEQLHTQVQRGSHKSCLSELQFLREELLEFSQKGFWLVLPYRVIKYLRAQGLLSGVRVSPMGVIPQRNRRPRLIVDLTFSGVNEVRKGNSLHL